MFDKDQPVQHPEFGTGSVILDQDDTVVVRFGDRVEICEAVLLTRLVSLSDAVRLGERKKDMQDTIAMCLGIDSDCVCVKATSFEGFGAVGRGEVIAAQAVATVTPR